MRKKNLKLIKSVLIENKKAQTENATHYFSFSLLKLSLFFDILQASCTKVKKEDYIDGTFKTNHSTAQLNQLAVLRQARSTLYDSLSGFNIKNMTVNLRAAHFYMNNHTYEHRNEIFDHFSSLSKLRDNRLHPYEYRVFGNIECLLLNTNLSSHEIKLNPNLNGSSTSTARSSRSTMIINTIIQGDTSNISIGKNAKLLNCKFVDCKLDIGSNSCLNDLQLNAARLKVPANVFMQTINVRLDCFEKDLTVSVVFGLNDDFNKTFGQENWKIMNMDWQQFKVRTGINESDLWSEDLNTDCRRLTNARLFPLIHSSLSSDELFLISNYFWLDLLNDESNTFLLNKNSILANKWRSSFRLSLDELLLVIDMQTLFTNRRNIFNTISNAYLVKSVVENRCIKFRSLLNNAIQDGYGNSILRQFDEGSL
jgi:hypothetical protein